MTGHKIISISTILLSALIVWVAAAESSTSIVAAATNASPKVSVFFMENRALTIEEIRTKAKELLKGKGHTIKDAFHCAINVGVLGKDAGCTVIFQDLSGRTLYTVGFNAKGDASVQYAGPVRHRTPGFGENVELPEGRKVRVKE